MSRYVTFDRGNNSDNTIDKLLEVDPNIHYVGGLRLSQVKEFLSISLTEYSEHKNKSGVKLYRMTHKIYDKKHTIVLLYDESSKSKQIYTLEGNIRKTLEELKDLNDKIVKNAGKGRSVESTNKKIKGILKREYMIDIIKYAIKEENGKISCVEYSVDEESKKEVIARDFGKRALYTNRDDWTSEEIEASYTAAWHVEHGFRQMKDVNCISTQPIYHWTDTRIRAHIFFCVMAYRVCCILRKTLQDNGINVSIDEMIETLSSYKKVKTVFNFSEIVETYTLRKDILNKMLEIFGI